MNERDQFGPSLRRERERRGVSLQEIANRTKISAALFAGLERNDVSRWPSGIYRRSFLRAYAEVVGLDKEQLVAQFTRLFPAEGDDQPVPRPNTSKTILPDPHPRGIRRPFDSDQDRQLETASERPATEPYGRAEATAGEQGSSGRVRLMKRLAGLSVDLGLVAAAGTVVLIVYGWPVVWPALALSSGVVLLATPAVVRTTPGTWLLTPRRVRLLPTEPAPTETTGQPLNERRIAGRRTACPAARPRCLPIRPRAGTAHRMPSGTGAGGHPASPSRAGPSA